MTRSLVDKLAESRPNKDLQIALIVRAEEHWVERVDEIDVPIFETVAAFMKDMPDYYEVEEGEAYDALESKDDEMFAKLRRTGVRILSQTYNPYGTYVLMVRGKPDALAKAIRSPYTVWAGLQLSKERADRMSEGTGIRNDWVVAR